MEVKLACGESPSAVHAAVRVFVIAGAGDAFAAARETALDRAGAGGVVAAHLDDVIMDERDGKTGSDAVFVEFHQLGASTQHSHSRPAARAVELSVIRKEIDDFLTLTTRDVPAMS